MEKAGLRIDGLAEGVPPPGGLLRIRAGREMRGRRLILKEGGNSALWYDGPAEHLDQRLWAMGALDLHLIARFRDSAGNELGGGGEIRLSMPENTALCLPGLVAKIIRTPEGEEPPPAGAFAALPLDPPDLFLEKDYLDYPIEREAESVRPVPPEDPEKPAFRLPGRHVVPLPSLNIAAANKIAERGALVKHPLDDLTRPLAAALRAEGLLLVERPGRHRFRLETESAARLELGTEIGGKNLEADLAAGAVPFVLTIRRDAGDPAFECRLLWQPPGAGSFSPLPEGRLAHLLDPARRRALEALRKEGGATTAAGPGDHATELLRGERGGLPVEDVPAWTKAVAALADAYLAGGEFPEGEAAARTALDLIHRRVEHMRQNPKTMKTGGFATKTDGRIMKLFVDLEPFFIRCMADPRLQKESLAGFAELSGYAVGTCLSRSFLTEIHHGANDAYEDDNNLVTNFWRAARALGTTYAWDAAANLMDNHYHYCAGVDEGLTSDGVFQFHNANGRQIHIGGYGMDWLARTLNARRHGSPWATTPEQYRRMAEVLLAYEWTHYREALSFAVNGRHNVHRSDKRKLVLFFERLTALPGPALPENTRREAEAALRRLREPEGRALCGNRFFHRNLFSVHRGKDWYIDVKMISPLSAGPETFAGAYPWNMAFGDGVATLLKDGWEYDRIHRNEPNASYSALRSWKEGEFRARDLSLWRYRSLPGTTMLDDEMHAPDRYRKGGGDRAGGVSDGELGHAGFHFLNQATGSEARKLFAFTRDGLAVLACGVNSLRKNPPADVTMRSTLNQCDARGPVQLLAADGRKRTLAEDGPDLRLRLPLNRAYLIRHAGVSYLVHPTGAEGGADRPGTLCLDHVLRTPLSPAPGAELPAETAAAIRKHVPAERRAKIFHLWIDHGPAVRDGRAVWFIDMEDRADPSWLQRSPVTALANDETLQALRDERDGTVHAFFHRAGRLEENGRLLFDVTAPAALMWRPRQGLLMVQDPLAACTPNLAEMSDRIGVTLGEGLGGITSQQHLNPILPGAADPDDRHRGRPLRISLPPDP